MLVGSNSLSLRPSSQYAVVDTGTSYIGVPSAYYDTLMKFITSQRSDCVSEGISYDSIYACSDTINPTKNLPTIYIKLYDENNEEITLTLNGNQYLDDDGQLGFMPLSLDIWIFGDTFLKNYYSVYDDQNSRLGLASSNYTDSSVSNMMETVLIVGIVVVCILLLLSFLRCYVSRKQSQELSSNGLLNNVVIPSSSNENINIDDDYQNTI